MCNGAGAIRETMILDDDLDDCNSDLYKTLQEIQHLENLHLQDGNTGDNEVDGMPNLSEEQKDKCSVGDDMAKSSNMSGLDVLALSDNTKEIDSCPLRESAIEEDKSQKHEPSEDNSNVESSSDANITDQALTLEQSDSSSGCKHDTEIDSATINTIKSTSNNTDTDNNDLVMNDNTSSQNQTNKEPVNESSTPTDQTNDQKHEKAEGDNENNQDDSIIPTEESNPKLTEISESQDKVSKESEPTSEDVEQRGQDKEVNSSDQKSLDEEKPAETNPETQDTKDKLSDLSTAVEITGEKDPDEKCVISDLQTQDEKIRINNQPLHNNSPVQVNIENCYSDEQLTQDSLTEESGTGNNSNETEHFKCDDQSENTSEQLSKADDVLPSHDCSDAPSNEVGLQPSGNLDDSQSTVKNEEVKEEKDSQSLSPSLNQDNNISKKDQETSSPSSVVDEKLEVTNNLKQASSAVSFASAQEDIASTTSSDSPSDSNYETPRSSQVIVGSLSDAVDGSNGCKIPPQEEQRKQEEPQSKSQNSSKKGKKKNQKGLITTGCLPVSCAGSSSPSFSRGNSTYGGSVKSR